MFLSLIFKIGWVCSILLFHLVQQSGQTSQNGTEILIERLQNLILSKWADLEYKIESMDERLRQVDALIKNDFKPKLENMEAKVNKIETQVAAIDKNSTSQTKILIEIKEKVENVENNRFTCGNTGSLDNALDGPINELKSQGISIHAAINTLTSNTLSLSTKMDNINNEIKQGIESIQHPLETKSCSTALNNFTTIISNEFQEGITKIVNPLKDLKAQANATLHELRLVKEDYLTQHDIAKKIDSIEANLKKSDECTPASANLQWYTVGGDKFVKFSEYTNWNWARMVCQANCLDLYRPNDAVAVAHFLKDHFSKGYFWVGSRGDGTNQVWVKTGEPVSRSDPWVDTDYNNVATDRCLGILTWDNYPEDGTVLGTRGCTADWRFICG